MQNRCVLQNSEGFSQLSLLKIEDGLKTWANAFDLANVVDSFLEVVFFDAAFETCVHDSVQAVFPESTSEKHVRHLHNFRHPGLVHGDLTGSVFNMITAAFAEKHLHLVCLPFGFEVVIDNSDHLRQRFDKHRRQVLLYDVAGEEEEDDVEVTCLVVSELDQAVENEQHVVLLELEVHVSISLDYLVRQCFQELIAELHFFSGLHHLLELLLFAPFGRT